MRNLIPSQMYMIPLLQMYIYKQEAMKNVTSQGVWAKRKKISSDDDKGDLVKVHASCQTFHSGVKMTQDNFTQCPEDFSYVTDEHKYCGSTQLLKPVISFSAVSQPFAAQEHSHPSTPEEEPEFQHVSALL
nr:uncharacterized protein LOC129274834 [Lytechinus pictus]